MEDRMDGYTAGRIEVSNDGMMERWWNGRMEGWR